MFSLATGGVKGRYISAVTVTQTSNIETANFLFLALKIERTHVNVNGIGFYDG
jgi:hypothetical protein